MNIQKTTPKTTFNGTCIIARTPKMIAKSEEIFTTLNGRFVKTTPREYINIDNGKRINALTKEILPANPALDFFVNKDGDVFKKFKSPIRTDKSFDNALRRTADQISNRVPVTISDDKSIPKVIETLKKNGQINRITIDNMKANRIIRQLEEELQEKIELTPEQPKYFLNCANKLFFVADYTQDDTQNGTIIKYIFDTTI